MLREAFFGGLLLCGGGYLYVNRPESAEIERIVDAPPEQVYRGFEVFLGQRGTSVTSLARPGGWSAETAGLPVEHLTREPFRDLDYVVDRAGKQVMRIHVRLRPVEGGAKTRLLLDYDLHALERMAEGQGALGGRAVRILFKRGMALLTDGIVAHIETGGAVDSSAVFDRMQAQLAADPELRDIYRGESMRAAERPMLNPNAVKVNPRGVDPTPMTRLPSNN